MATQAVVQILIRAKDEASRVLKAIGADANTLGLALAGIGAAGVGMATAMALTAARTEELGLMVNKMGEVHGLATQEIARTEQAVNNLGIRTQVTRLLLTQLMATQIDLAYATRIARAAQDLATLGQVESSEAVADLAYAIASLQPRLLRKYRIYISLVKVYRDAAKALGTTIENLTMAERRHAFLNAVLQEAAQYTGLYEEKMKTASGQLRSMPRYIEEVANTLGQVYVPAVRDAIMVTGDFLTAVAKMEGVAPDAIGLIIGMAGQFILLAGTMVLLAPKIMSIVKGLEALSFATGIMGTSVLGTIVVIAGVITAITGAIIAWRRYRDIVTRGSEDVTKAGIKAGKSYDEMRLAMIEAYMAMSPWQQAVLDATGGMEGWILRIIGAREEYEHLYRVLTYTLPKAQEWQLALYDTATAWDEVKWAQEAAMSSVEAVQQAYSGALINMAAFFGTAERKAEQYESERLTLERRIQRGMSELQERGYDEQLANQVEADQRRLHELDKSYQQQREAMNRQLGMMLITQIQAADLGIETATRMSLAVAEAYGIAGPEQARGALRLFAPLFELQRGLIPEEVATRRMTAAAGGFQSGGGVNVAIGNLYGTDRTAATKFGQQIGRDLLSLGVRTR